MHRDVGNRLDQHLEQGLDVPLAHLLAENRGDVATGTLTGDDDPTRVYARSAARSMM